MKKWVRRSVVAENLNFSAMEDGYDNIRLKFDYRVEGRTNTHVTDVVVEVDIYQIARLVEQARPIADAQIERAQAIRRRLG